MQTSEAPSILSHVIDLSNPILYPMSIGEIPSTVLSEPIIPQSGELIGSIDGSLEALTEMCPAPKLTK